MDTMLLPKSNSPVKPFFPTEFSLCEELHQFVKRTELLIILTVSFYNSQCTKKLQASKQGSNHETGKK